ncbi:hypothetical protein PROP_02179 [Propionicimonas sp. T2.31MG-18]
MAGKNIAEVQAVPAWMARFLHNFPPGALVREREE